MVRTSGIHRVWIDKRVSAFMSSPAAKVEKWLWRARGIFAASAKKTLQN
jgi:hypothetical protein